MNEYDQYKYTLDRLTRLESRLVEGFAQLGVNVTHKPAPMKERIRIDPTTKRVYICDQSVSIGEIMRHIENDTQDNFDILLESGKLLCNIAP